MTPRDAFLIGWLDAVWSAFQHDIEPRIPRDVIREFKRRGWLAPGRPIGPGVRDAQITPLGCRIVREANEEFGINRTSST